MDKAPSTPSFPLILLLITGERKINTIDFVRLKCYIIIILMRKEVHLK
jgi:hypothetical protein